MIAQLMPQNFDAALLNIAIVLVMFVVLLWWAVNDMHGK